MKEEYNAAGEEFSRYYTRQDAAILNLIRAFEQSIDLANHIIKIRISAPRGGVFLFVKVAAFSGMIRVLSRGKASGYTSRCRIKKLGVPNRSSDSFEILGDRGIIDPELAEKMIRMSGFRNTAIHQYQKLNLSIVTSIIEKRGLV